MHNKLILSTIAIALGVTAINTGFPDDSNGVEIKNYSYYPTDPNHPLDPNRDPMGITSNLDGKNNCFDENGNPAACNYPTSEKPRFVYLYCPVDNIVRAVNQFRDDVSGLLGDKTDTPNPLGDLTTSDPFAIAELSKLNSINLIDGNSQFDDGNIITLPPWKTSADGNTNLEKRTSILNMLVDGINKANKANENNSASVISLSPQNKLTDKNIAIIKLPSGFTIRNNPWNGGGIPGVDILQDSLHYHINGQYPNLNAVFHVTNTRDKNNIMDNVKTPYTSPIYNNSRKLFYGVCSGTLSYNAIKQVDPDPAPAISLSGDGCTSSTACTLQWKDQNSKTVTVNDNYSLSTIGCDEYNLSFAHNNTGANTISFHGNSSYNPDENCVLTLTGPDGSGGDKNVTITIQAPQ